MTPIIDMQETGKRIKHLRKSAGMTVKELQTVCGVSAASVTKWQSGKSLPSLDNMVILASVWSVSIDAILVTKML